MRRTVLTILMLLLALPATAVAQTNEDGVIIDPDSPTSKEYAVPTEEARQDASGGSGGSSAGGNSSGGSEAPLFGVGVDSKDGKDGSGDGQGGTAGTSESSDPTGGVTNTSSASGDADAGVSTGAISLGIALLVLLIGGGIAYALKRREGWTFPGFGAS